MIEKLPNEILAQVFEHLPPQSLHTTSMVSNHWYRVAQALGVCRLNFSRFSEQQLENENAMITHILNTIPTDTEQVNIRHILIQSNYLLPNSLFHFIQQQCRNVISFDYGPNLLDTVNSALITRRKRHPLYTSTWQKTIAHLPACHREDQNWSYDNELCKRLQTLHIHDGDHLLKYATKNYCGLRLPYLPHLDALTLHSTFKFRENILNNIRDWCPRLTTLEFCNTSLTCVFHRVKYSTDKTTVYFDHTLTVLKLQNVTFLNIQTFDFFPSKYPIVHTFTLFINFESHRGLNAYYVLGIRGCIVRLIHCFQHLKKLTIRLQGFGIMEDPVNQSFQSEIETHFYRSSATSYTDFSITFV